MFRVSPKAISELGGCQRDPKFRKTVEHVVGGMIEATLGDFRPTVRPTIRSSDHSSVRPAHRPSVHQAVRPSIRPPFRPSGLVAEQP